MEISSSGALLEGTNASSESGFAMFLQKNIQRKPFHLQHGNIPLLYNNYSTECFQSETQKKRWNEMAVVTQPTQCQGQA